MQLLKVALTIIIIARQQQYARR